MKLIIREYLASLKERNELDAVLPDLLSELGFVVYSRPQSGTVQYGVDIAAVGVDEDGERKIFLFSVKQGDLTRQGWDGTPQALRSSLNEMRDVYIPSRILAEHRGLKIVICLCFGGDVQEQVRSALTGYINANTTTEISFREWNGDKLADLLLKGVLREEILPRQYRSAFQKAVAMVDEPDVAYTHFAELAERLSGGATASLKVRVTVVRQLYICLWILYVWARDVENVEAPYRLSELVILRIWDLLRPLINDDSDDKKPIMGVLFQLIQLHLKIATEYLNLRIFPYVNLPDALSLATAAQSSADVNLKLFDLLGRIAMTGLWFRWLFTATKGEISPDTQKEMTELSANGIMMIQNNPALILPLCDSQSIEVTLFLLVAAGTLNPIDISWWLNEMTKRLGFAVRSRGRYPSVSSDYRDLIDHPKDRSDAYFEETTSASTLIPLLAAWLCALKESEAVAELAKLVSEKLPHCTLQLWLPDKTTEELIYRGGHDQGIALSNLSIATCDGLLETISDACRKELSFAQLSANKAGYWPIILLACRHYRLPVPPQFWIDLVGAVEPAPPSNSPTDSESFPP
jgi:hypothetical protein